MRRSILLYFFLLLSSVGTLFASEPLDKPLKTDGEIITGTLDNGMKYIIRSNPYPYCSAHLRLVVDVGSVDEEEYERGLAHFVEHMAFNGTKSFAKNELIHWLQSLGGGFGPDLNAWTSFDNTVYRIQVPYKELGALDTGLTVLKEWAFHLSLTDEDIEQERGVILEEWRKRLSGSASRFDMAAPILLSGSDYGQRLPIGDMDIVTGCEPEALRTFYKKWYTPDRMTLIITGDFNSNEVEEKISHMFAPYQSSEASLPERTPVVLNDETLYHHYPDVEVSSGILYISSLKEAHPVHTGKEYEDEILLDLYERILDSRLNSRAMNDSDIPYISSSVYSYYMTRELLLHRIQIDHDPERVEDAYTAVMEELEKVKRFGLTETELEMARNEILAEMRGLYKSRRQKGSTFFAEDYTDNVLYNRVNISIANEYKLYKKILSEIDLETLKDFYTPLLASRGRSVIEFSPRDMDSVPSLTSETFSKIEEDVSEAELTPDDDEVEQGTLLVQKPRPGRILRKSYNPDAEIYEWKLSNGVRILFKRTRNQQGIIKFAAYSPGGELAVKTEDLMSSRIAVPLFEHSGAGDKSSGDLLDILQKRDLSVDFYIEEQFDEIWGYSSARDFETLLELIHLSMTSFRKNTKVADKYMNRKADALKKRYSDPMKLFRDRSTSALYGNSPRVRALNSETLSQADPDKAYELFRQKFGNARDFTFIFVGSINPDQLEDEILSYIGSLPSSKETEEYQDPAQEIVRGGYKEVVYAGKNPKSVVDMVWPADFSWNYDDVYTAKALARMLEIHLEERIREDESGTYSLSMGMKAIREPEEKIGFWLEFQCDPERVEELISVIHREVEAFKRGDIDDELIQAVRTQLKDRYLTRRNTNWGWLEKIMFLDKNNQDLSPIKTFELKHILNIEKEDFVSFLNDYIEESECVITILYPESYE